MPLDIDQYNVRRYYRHGMIRITTEKTKRNPETGAIIGKESVDLFKFKYKQASMTSEDAKMMTSQVLQRIKKKIEIPYSYELDHYDQSQLMAYVDNLKYNIEKTEPTYNNRMFIYLSAVSSTREVSNA